MDIGFILPKIESAEAAVAFHLDKEYASQDYLNFYLDLVKVELALFESWADKIDILAPDSAELQSRLEKGFYLTDPKRVEVDDSYFSKALEEISEVYLKYNQEGNADIEKIKESSLTANEWIELALQRKPEPFAKKAKEKSINEELLKFFVEQLSRPMIWKAAQTFTPQIPDEVWSQGFCPICGNDPNMAVFSEEEEREGRRVLNCSLCGYLWTFNRLKCPYCANDDQTKLKYLSLRQDNPYRIDVCLKCKKYIKTVDERKLPSGTAIVVPAEDAATLYLDILAGKEGYTRA